MSELVTMDGFDDCILGITMRYGQPNMIAYDIYKIIDKHMAGGMTKEEAWEFFEYNQLGAWVGEATPCFVDTQAVLPSKE